MNSVVGRKTDQPATGTITPIQDDAMPMKTTTTQSALPPGLAHFDQLPDSAYVRIATVRALRGGISSATVWRHVKAGLIPAPLKLGPKTTGWNVGALRRMA